MSTHLQTVDLSQKFNNTLKEIRQLLALHQLDFIKNFNQQDQFDFNNIQIEKELERLSIFKESIQTSFEISQEEGLWRLFNKLNITPHQDFLNLKNKSFIQYFDSQGVLYFQTMDCFKYISYTYQDLITYDWSTLYERDPEITNLLYNKAIEVMTTKKCVSVNTGFHKVTERLSVDKMSLLINIIDAYPVFHRNTNLVSGFLTNYEIKKILN